MQSSAAAQRHPSERRRAKAVGGRRPTPVAQAGDRSPSREGAGKSQKLSSQGPASVVT